MASNIVLGTDVRLRAQIGRWERRLRLVQSLDWLPRLIAIALGIGIVAAVIARLRPWLLPTELLLLTVVALSIVLVVGFAFIWLYPRPLLESARRFDRALDLRERTTAALELLDGSIHANDELRLLQLEGALGAAENARPQAALPLPFSRRDWGIAALLSVILALLFILPNAQTNTVAQDEAQASAIAEAAETVREISRDVAINPDLDEQTREALLQSLATSLDALDQPGVTPEEAFAALSDAENALREEGTALSEQAEAARQGLASASQALRNLPTLTQEQADQSLSDLLEQMGVQAGQFSEAERTQAAQALQSAAQAAQATNPQVAQEMREAAQAMQEANAQSTQTQLNEAQQAAQSSEANQQSAQNAAQQLEQSANQAQQANQQMSQQQSQQSSQQSGQQQGQPQSSNQQGQQTSSGAEQSASQPGDSQTQPGRNGEQQSAQDAQSSAQGEASQDASSGQQSQSAQGESAQQNGQSASAASGAGDQAASSPLQGAQAGQQSQNNQADGVGQSSFDTIYAPTRLGDDGNGTQSELEAGGSGAPVQEGEFSQNPIGQSNVPYNEVFGQYADAANRALESDYVPLGMRDVVRDYFTGLEPRR
jgi:hypothetical protein